MSSVKVGGSWKTPTQTFVKVGGSWKTVSAIYVKVGGAWKVTDFAAPPATPDLSHTAYGQFTITNYDASLTYAVTNGTRTGAVITVPSVNSTMTVTSAYGSGAPTSGARSGERKAHRGTSSNVTVSYIHAPPAHGLSNVDGTPGSYFIRCNQFAPPLEGECGHQEGYNVLVNEPGYTDQYGEWFKIT